MGIRRRRKQLTTMMSSLDQRVRSVELRPVSLLTAGQINAAVVFGQATVTESFFLGSSATNTYHIIQDAYYYPKKLTGKDSDLVEIYVQTTLGLSVDKRIEVKGIHGTSSTIIDVTSDDFTVKELSESPWTDRESYMHDPTQDQLPGVTIGYSYSVTPDTLAPTSWSTRQRLDTKIQLESFEIDGSTVTITTASNHRFEAGDVVYTNLYTDSPYHNESTIAFGIDGFFIVTAATATTLSYTVAAGVDGNTGTITPTAPSIYIFPTARNWSNVGDTWIDTSTDPSTTYYWSGLRWTVFTASTPGLGADSIAPSPVDVATVEVIAAESGSYTNDLGIPRARIAIQWEAPTTNSDESTLSDLAGYDIWVSYVSNSDWVKSGLLDADTTFTITDIDPAKTIYFEIYAVDTSLNRSTKTVFSAVSGTYASVLNPLSAPKLISDLGVVVAQWDGLDNTGVNPHPSIRYVETHVGFNSTFTTSAASRVASMTATTGNYSSIYQYNDGTGTLIDMAYGTDYYFKFVAVDSAGNKTTGSSSQPARVSQVDGGSIEAGAISAKILDGETITATSGLSAYAIELNANHLRAYNKTSGVETFRMQTSDGAVTIGSGITNTKIDGNSITVANLSATAITTGTLEASLITVANLSATSITSGVLNADNITVTGSISGSRITGGTITGSTLSGGELITTPVDSKSVRISGSDTEYRYNGSVVASIASNSGADQYSPKLEILSTGTSNNGWSMLLGDTSTLFGGSSATVGVAGSVNVFLAGNTGIAFASAGRGQFQEGIEFDSAQNYTLKIVSGRLESSANFRAAADLNIGGDLYWSGTIGTGTTYPMFFTSSTKQVYRLSSSERYKTNIADTAIDIDKFLSATPRKFQNKADVEKSGTDNVEWTYGFIAEELETLGLTEFLVYENKEDGSTELESVNYMSMSIILHQAVKEQAQKLKDLESRIEALEGN
tara:strand:- start:416 stop:3277 length:2862 start_codon:yes stop_codon:yes gene_type:complete